MIDDLIDEINELNHKIECIEKTLETWELGLWVAQMPSEVRRVMGKCCKQLRRALDAKLPLDYNDIEEFRVEDK